MKIKKIKSKTILSKTGLPADYVINPYVGCLHACSYCYARFMKRFTGHREPWGQFLDIKINAPELLAKEIKKKKKGKVMFSSVTDPYLPLEKKYQLTRQCLKILLEYQWPICILTKSSLILRDLDIIKQFKEKEVTMTITTLDPKVQKILEPGASLPQQRVKVLEKFHQVGIRTCVFVAPILPYFTDLEALFRVLRGKVDEIWFDDLNILPEYWKRLEKVLKIHWPQILVKYKEIFFKNRRKYQRKLRAEIQNLGKKYKIPARIYF
jgi:DNA repair photolyase